MFGNVSVNISEHRSGSNCAGAGYCSRGRDGRCEKRPNFSASGTPRWSEMLTLTFPTVVGVAMRAEDSDVAVHVR